MALSPHCSFALQTRLDFSLSAIVRLGLNSVGRVCGWAFNRSLGLMTTASRCLLRTDSRAPSRDWDDFDSKSPIYNTRSLTLSNSSQLPLCRKGDPDSYHGHTLQNL